MRRPARRAITHRASSGQNISFAVRRIGHNSLFAAIDDALLSSRQLLRALLARIFAAFAWRLRHLSMLAAAKQRRHHLNNSAVHVQKKYFFDVVCRRIFQNNGSSEHFGCGVKCCVPSVARGRGEK